MAVGSKLNTDGAGANLAASQIALSGGWGTTASAAIKAGSNDAAGEIAITSAGTGQGANPTCTVTFAKAKDREPIVIVAQADDADDTLGVSFVVDPSTTAFVVTTVDTPVAAEVYTFSYVVVEV